jgi:hypothetical protein
MSVYAAIDRNIANNKELYDKYNIASRPGRGSDAAASEMLDKAGIPGIKYFDEHSRDARFENRPDATRNLVLFNDKNATILSINGTDVIGTKKAMPPPGSSAARVLSVVSPGWLRKVLGPVNPTKRLRVEEDGEMTNATLNMVPTVENIKSALKPLLIEMPGMHVEVIQSHRDLPNMIKYDLAKSGEDGSDSRGIYFSPTDTIFLIADNMDNLATAHITLLHEAVAHRGLRVLFKTQEELDFVLDDIFENGRTDMFDMINKVYEYDLTIEKERRNATEEYVAALAEQGDQAGILQRIVDRVREILRAVGVVKDWTEADIHALLRDTRRAIRGRELGSVDIEHNGTQLPADIFIRQFDKKTVVVEKLRDCLA